MVSAGGKGQEFTPLDGSSTGPPFLQLYFSLLDSMWFPELSSIFETLWICPSRGHETWGLAAGSDSGNQAGFRGGLG